MTQNTVWKDGSFSQDSWKYPASDEKATGDIVVALAAYQALEGTGHEGRLGLLVNPDDDMEAIAAVLHAFDMVVVNFPVFTDGRAFSIARLIREKLGFSGEIRAKGAYILDQMPMLVRCGVSSFDISSPAIEAGLKRGDWPEIAHYYQHALDGRGNEARSRPVDLKRPWISVVIEAEAKARRTAA